METCSLIIMGIKIPLSLQWAMRFNLVNFHAHRRTGETGFQLLNGITVMDEPLLIFYWQRSFSANFYYPFTDPELREF